MLTVGAKKPRKEKERQPVQPGAKQTTLFGMKKPSIVPAAPKPVHQESTASTETDGEYEQMEETQTDDYEGAILQETMEDSPEPMDD